MSITSENIFETAIIENLTTSGGYSEGDAGAYSPEPGMFKAEVFQFLPTTQTQQWFTDGNAGTAYPGFLLPAFAGMTKEKQIRYLSIILI